MTEKQRRDYAAKNIRRVNLFRRQFLPGVLAIITRQFRQAARLVRAGKIQQLRNQTNIIPGLGAELQKLYNTVGVFYANQTLREINRAAREEKGFGLNQEWIDAIKEYFRLYLLNKAVLPISETTFKEILAILIKGEQEGWGVDKMAFEIEHSTDLMLYRARMIVRTEILKAQNYGQQLGEEESQWETTKEWVSADDARVRNSHRLIDGTVVKSDGKFYVKKRKGGYDAMNGPGDPEASAENVINCRCRTVVAPVRDSNGRLVRKRKISVLLPSDVARTRREVVTI